VVTDRITLFRGDITQLCVDAIVNAANHQLTVGGAVGRVIHAAAGPELLAECMTYPRCRDGKAVITGGYRLQARYVIHAVGPSWHGGNRGEAALLARTYRSCFELAHAHNIRTIAFPAISCGLYSYPVAEAAEISVRATAQALALYPDLERVTFALFTENVFAAFAQALATLVESGEAILQPNERLERSDSGNV
jgi:O-acetyl-ADP-ribose deacetylase (regulator of RNase III)